MARPETSFWGSPSLEPRDPDVARFLETIREITKNYPPKRSLSLATSAMQAIVAFVIHTHGPREALALLDKLKAEIVG